MSAVARSLSVSSFSPFLRDGLSLLDRASVDGLAVSFCSYGSGEMFVSLSSVLSDQAWAVFCTALLAPVREGEDVNFNNLDLGSRGYCSAVTVLACFDL
jgi:hypothetical protein